MLAQQSMHGFKSFHNRQCICDQWHNVLATYDQSVECLFRRSVHIPFLSICELQVPVAHCFGPAGQKKRFCCVCRKHLEGNTAVRCEGWFLRAFTTYNVQLMAKVLQVHFVEVYRSWCNKWVKSSKLNLSVCVDGLHDKVNAEVYTHKVHSMYIQIVFQLPWGKSDWEPVHQW